MTKALIVIALALLVSACGDNECESLTETVIIYKDNNILEDWRSHVELSLGAVDYMLARPKNYASLRMYMRAFNPGSSTGETNLYLCLNQYDGEPGFRDWSSYNLNASFIFRLDDAEVKLTTREYGLRNILLGGTRITDKYKVFKPMLRDGLSVTISPNEALKLTQEEITAMQAMISFWEFWIAQ